MAPNHGLVHLKEYDIKDSNVELIGTDIDHQVKYNSALTEPAWNDGAVGARAGLWVWRIEDFEVIAWPEEKHGEFYDGDSYIVLHSFEVGTKEGTKKLAHDIFFWLGAHTSQDEAGVAAYKTVELDEFLRGVATQHRELQASQSDDFLELFPRLKLRSGGVRSGFRHVEKEEAEPAKTLLHVFKHPTSPTAGVVVHEVEPSWESLDEDDVFVLDTGEKIWVWQGKTASPMEKAKAAQVVHDMTLAKHVDVEVIAQMESKSGVIVRQLGGDGTPADGFHCPRPTLAGSAHRSSKEPGPQKLLRLSDGSGRLSLDLVKEGEPISAEDLDAADVFVLDDGGKAIWVWEGEEASKGEKAMWLRAAQAYLRQLDGQDESYLTPIAKVKQGSESQAFLRAIRV
jgi:gelsolin